MNNATFYLFFFSGATPLSNFYCKEGLFSCSGIKFHCAEQYYCWQKAKFFKDKDAEKQILEETVPAKIKRTPIQGYNNQKWNSTSHKVMEDALTLKFNQNEECKAFLLSTKELKLVEANRHDNYWGIGKSLDAASVSNKDQWGQNRLGKQLMAIRQKLTQPSCNS